MKRLVFLLVLSFIVFIGVNEAVADTFKPALDGSRIIMIERDNPNVRTPSAAIAAAVKRIIATCKLSSTKNMWVVIPEDDNGDKLKETLSAMSGIKNVTNDPNGIIEMDIKQPEGPVQQLPPQAPPTPDASRRLSGGKLIIPDEGGSPQTVLGPGDGDVSPDDPYYDPWQRPVYDLLKAEKAWKESTGSDDVTVAILGTGIDPTHEDLQGRIDPNSRNFVTVTESQLQSQWGYDPVPGEHYGPDPDWIGDVAGYGTMYAGVVGATGNNGIGIAGIDWQAKILSARCQVLAKKPDGSKTLVVYQPDVLAAMEWVKDKADVAVITHGTKKIPNGLEDVINEAYDLGCLTIAKASNETAPNLTIYPAAFEKVVSVGAATHDGYLAALTTYGDSVDIVMPSEPKVLTLKGADTYYPDVENTFNLDSHYGWDQGTRISACQLGGLIALIKAKFPDLSNDEIVALIKKLGRGLALHTGVGADMPPLGVMDRYLKSDPLNVPELAAVKPVTFTCDDEAEGDGDHILEPGETVQVTIGLQNHNPNSEGMEFNGTLQIISPFVQVTPGARNWVLGGYRSVGQNDVPFEVVIAPNCPKNHKPKITLTLEQQGQDTQTLELEVVFNRVIEDNDTITGQALYGNIDDGATVTLDQEAYIPEGQGLSARSVIIESTQGAQNAAVVPAGLYIKGRAYLENVTAKRKAGTTKWAGIIVEPKGEAIFSGSNSIEGTAGNHRIPEKSGQELFLLADATLRITDGELSLKRNQNDFYAKENVLIELDGTLKANDVVIKGSNQLDVSRLIASGGGKIIPKTAGGGSLDGTYVEIQGLTQMSERSDLTLNHATVVNCSASPRIFDGVNTVNISGSIDYFNNGLLLDANAHGSIKYTCTQDKQTYEDSSTITTQGNIDSDPLFTDYPDLLTLESASECLFAIPPLYDHMGAYGLNAGSVIIVAKPGDPDADFNTIQEAIDAVVQNPGPEQYPWGSIIMVKKGTYEENLDIFFKWLRLISFDGPEETIVDAPLDYPVLKIDGAGWVDGMPTMIKGFTLTHGEGVSGGSAGGLAVSIASVRIIDNIIADNDMDGIGGGGIYVTTVPDHPQSFELIGNTIDSNIATSNSGNGGGLHIQASSYDPYMIYPLVIANNVFSNNIAQDGAGGAIYLRGIHNPAYIVNNIITGNIADDGWASGIMVMSSDGTILANNTIVGNRSTNTYEWLHGLIIADSVATLTNNILWDNAYDEWTNSAEICLLSGSVVTADYNNVQDDCGNGYYKNYGSTMNWGSHNKEVDPDFVDPQNGDFHLRSVSLCRDAGDNSAVGEFVFDIDWEDRIMNDIVDIGADEFAL